MLPVLRIKRSRSRRCPTKAARKDYPHEFLVREELLEVVKQERLACADGEPQWVISMDWPCAGVEHEPQDDADDAGGPADVPATPSSPRAAVKEEPVEAVDAWDDVWDDPSPATTPLAVEATARAAAPTTLSTARVPDVWAEAAELPGRRGARAARLTKPAPRRVKAARLALEAARLAKEAARLDVGSAGPAEVAAELDQLAAKLDQEAAWLDEEVARLDHEAGGVTDQEFARLDQEVARLGREAGGVTTGASRECICGSRSAERPGSAACPAHPYRCDCGRRFHAWDNLRKHLRGFHSATRSEVKAVHEKYKKPRPLKVKTAKKEKVRKVRAATSKRGGPGRMYKCGVCGMSLTFSDLRRHVASHARPFPCDKCDRSFTSQDNLQRHKHGVHSTVRYVCDVCAVEAKTLGRLNRHKEVVHGARRFGCGVCQRMFASASNLRQHSVTHTGERPFACRHCGDTFRFNAARNVHERDAHPSP